MVKQQMREDPHVTMSLDIAGSPGDMQVIGVNGQDRLNAPFCFDVDMVTWDATFDGNSLLQREAWLTFGVDTDNDCGVHGQVYSVRRLHRGVDLTLYRVRLMPALQRLGASVRRRSHNGLTVPQTIARLLDHHGVAQQAFRFDPLTGVYPAREHCVQYDESDLQLLCRLCEEEGISFRFEQQRDGHCLVFSDDPAAFPERPTALHPEHLVERLSVQTCHSSHAGERYAPDGVAAPAGHDGADNQPSWPGNDARENHRHCQQRSVRNLERLRCERRDIRGRSNQGWLRSGQVIRVEGQPDALLNDHWLLTHVRHCAKQLAPLKDCPSSDAIGILQAIRVANRDWPQAASELPLLASYSNHFLVIPWAMPFRPSVKHHRPVILETLLATQTADLADPLGRVKIRYDWQPQSPVDHELDSWASVVSSLGQHRAGTRLRIRFFEGDPDQPLVCGTLGDGQDTARVIRVLQADGAAYEPAAPSVQLGVDEQLRVDSAAPLLLRGARATLRITEDGILCALRKRP
jgi:type VI secretion system secreted protein VgrG